MKKTLFTRLTAVAALAFFFASCSNSVGGGIDYASDATVATTASTGSTASGNPDGMLITFTGNPAYDITLLNDYWAKNGTPFGDGNTAGITAGTATDDTASRSVIGGDIPGPLFDVGDAAKDAAINGFGDLVKNFSGTNLLTWAGGTALSGGISAVAGTGVSFLLDALGLVKSTTAWLKEISEKLDAIQNQLNTMQAMLVELGEQVEKVNTEVKYQGTLTRYYSVMQDRNKQYNNIYITAMNTYNRINDVILGAALSSQYEDATEKANKLAELSTKKQRLAYIASFIDKDSWEKATSADGVKIADTDAGKAFEAYFKEHASEISASLAVIIKDWGASTTTGADSVFKLCAYLTDSTYGTANERFNMFNLYDKYAEVSFVWEQEGYGFRQQMRDQDSALIAMTAPLAYWYFALTETLGANSTNSKELAAYVDAAIALNQNVPITKHSTPIYQKWGSQWQGQVFTGTIKQIDYADILTRHWVKDTDPISSSSIGAKYPLNEKYNRHNSSRLYAGLPPRTKKPADDNAIYEEAKNLAFSEDFYSEMFNAYAVSSSLGKKYRSLMSIFKSVGFVPESGVTIPDTPHTFHGYSQFFITNLFCYARTIPAGGRDYYISIPVVTANSDSQIMYNGSMYKHEECPLLYTAREVYHVGHYGRGTHKSDVTDDYRPFLKVAKKLDSYHFYYPEKADTALVAE